jgi:hypothetical protein
MVALLLIVLLLLICLLALGSVFAEEITLQIQRRLPKSPDGGEQLMLWGGILLSVITGSVLVAYLFCA